MSTFVTLRALNTVADQPEFTDNIVNSAHIVRFYRVPENELGVHSLGGRHSEWDLRLVIDDLQVRETNA